MFLRMKKKPQKRGPFDGCRDDWQTPGKSGPMSLRRAKKMRKPPFKTGGKKRGNKVRD